MKLNEYLSLRIIDRKNVNLQYFSGTKNIRYEGVSQTHKLTKKKCLDF